MLVPLLSAKRKALGEGEEMPSRHGWCVGFQWSFSWAPGQWIASLVHLSELTGDAWEQNSWSLDTANCTDKISYKKKKRKRYPILTFVFWLYRFLTVCSKATSNVNVQLKKKIGKTCQKWSVKVDSQNLPIDIINNQSQRPKYTFFLLVESNVYNGGTVLHHIQTLLLKINVILTPD